MLPIDGGSVPFIPLILFGGSPFSAGFDLTPGWSTWIIDSLVSPVIIDAPLNPMQGYFWTSADGIYLFGQGTKGLTIPDEAFFSSESTPLRLRWILKGTKVSCPL